MKKRIIIIPFITLLLIVSTCVRTFAAVDPLPAVHGPYNLRDRFDTDLFTGTATYSYDIKVPKGTDDFTPNVSLSYNSAGARGLSERAGIGWQLTQDYVERDVNFTPGDTSDDKFRLHFKGGVYDLVYVSSDSRYHTKVESNLNIQKLTGGSNDYSDYWQVITTDGTKYRFGFASQSELGCNGRSFAAGWNLDQVTDVHGNNIYYTYTESNGASYLSQIKYNNDQTREVDFTYGTNSYQRQVYSQGCNVSESSILNTVQVKTGNNLVHEYDLSYTTAGNNQQLLHSITEKGSDGSSILPATTFDYKTENKTWNTSSQTWINNAPMDVNLTKTDVEMADVNGDGLLDIVKSEGNGSNTWKVWKNTGSGWNTTYETWINNAPIDAKLDRSDTRFMDVNGDGLPDIIKASNASTWQVWRNTGNSWDTNTESWANLSSYGSEHYLGSGVTMLVDVTGDGLPDVVTGDSNLWRVFRNLGNRWNGSPETWITSINQTLADSTYRIMDVNGDGLADIVRVTANGTSDTWQVWKNTGSSWNSSPETWINNAPVDANFSQTNVVVMDVNGDGLPDIVKSDDLGSADKWKVLINQGNSWSTTWETWIDPSSNVDLSLQANTQMADVTGDGLPDIIKGYDTGNPGGSDTWLFWKNNGLSPDLLSAVHTSQGGTVSYNYSQADTAVSETTSSASYTGQYFANETLSGSPALTRTDSAINFDWGSGSPDPSIPSDHFSVRWTQTTSFSGGSYIFTSRSDDGVRLYADGELILDKWFNQGATTYTASKALTAGNHTITYEYFEDTGSAVAQLSYQKIGLPFPLWQVSQMTTNNGLTNTQGTNDVTAYSYNNGFYKFEDPEFRGYGGINTAEPNGSKKKYIFNQDNASKGRPASIQTTDSSDNLYSKTEDTWSNTQTNGVYTANLTSEKNYTYDGSASNPKTAEIDSQYDTYGNITKKSELGDTSTNTDDRFTYNVYTTNPSLWIVNTLSDTYLNKSDDSTKVSETWNYYDNNANLTDAPTKGDLTKQVKWLSGGTNPATTYTYDSYGNKTQETDANNHSTSWSYGTTDTTHTYPDSTTDAKTQTTSMTYDLGTGNLLSKTDPNNFVTSYSYDVFGRISKEIDPYDTSSYPTINYTYYDNSSAPQGTLVSKRKVSGQSGTLDTYAFVDGLGRTLQTRAPAEDTTKQIVTDIYYDPSGKVSKQSVPHLDTLATAYTNPVSGIESTNTAYDPVERPVTITNPQGTTKTIAYNHWTQTSTDENGHNMKKYFDAFNNILQVNEYNSGVTFSTYYNYDPLNNLTKITDALVNITNYTFDTLNRKITMVDPDMGTYHYQYDAVGNQTQQTDNRGRNTNTTYDALNRIASVSYPTDPAVTYTYDTNTKGTLAQVQDAAGTVSYTYDNRLRKTQDQRVTDGITWTTSYAYDAADRLVSTTKPGGEIVTNTFNAQGEIASASGVLNNIDYNALDKVTGKTYANGLTTNYTYNTTDFRLNRIQTGTVQDVGYTYDNVGNVASTTDNLLSKTQSFAYDDVNRLLTAQETNGYNYAYAYNAIGNLTQFTNAGNAITYTYDQTSGPHALTSSNEPSPTPTPTPPSGGNIALRAAASGNNGAGSSTLTINKPAGTTSGDVMVAHVNVRVAGNTITSPSGWNLIQRQDSGSSISTTTYWKLAGSSEPTSYTWNFGTSGEASGGIASYIGVDNTSPIDASVAQYNFDTSTVTTLGVTTTVANDMLVFAVSITAPTTVNTASGFNEEWSTTSLSGTTSEMSDKLDPNTGATGTINASHNGGSISNITHLIALKPANAPTPTPTSTLTFTPTPTPASGVTISNLINGSDNDGNASATTASVNLSANKLYLLTVESSTYISTNPVTPGATGDNLTWTQVNSVVFDPVGTSRRRITLFRAMGASPSNGSLSISFSSQNQVQVTWSLEQVSGTDTSGTNGSGAIVQSANGLVNTGTSLTVNLASFSNTANATFGTFANWGGDPLNIGSGFTQVAKNTTLDTVLSEFKSTNDTTVDADGGGASQQIGGIAVEIKAAP